MDLNTTASDWDSWDPMKEDHQSSMNTLTLDPDRDTVATITGNHVSDGDRVCEKYLKHGECMDNQFCQKLHVDSKKRKQLSILQETYETNKNRTILNFTYLSPQEIKPNPNSLLLVSVTNVRSPSDFYVVMPYENKDFAQCTPEDLNFYIDQVKTSSPARSKLQEIHNNLMKMFDHEFRIDNVNDIIYQSQVVACKTRDGQFRRAMVIDIPEGDKFEYDLFLLDLGINIELPRECIYDIRAECLSEAPMAVHCRLDLNPVRGAVEWEDSVLTLFEKMTRGQLYLLCSIIDYSEQDQIYTVDLLHTSTRSSLTDKLSDTSLAVKSG